jgi:hypothetical protein
MKAVQRARELHHAQPRPRAGEICHEVYVEGSSHVMQWSDECVHAAYVGCAAIAFNPSSDIEPLPPQIGVNLLGDADRGFECAQPILSRHDRPPVVPDAVKE